MTSKEQIADLDALSLVQKARDDLRGSEPAFNCERIEAIFRRVMHMHYANYHPGDNGYDHINNRKIDLIEIAAHCVAWLEQLEKREKP